MLQENFLSTDQLGDKQGRRITEIERTGLIAVLRGLESGRLPLLDWNKTQIVAFDIGTIFDDGWVHHNCGTVGCYCGWAHHLTGGEAFPDCLDLSWRAFRARIPEQLYDLFAWILPQAHLLYGRKPTADDFARELRSYLTTGKVFQDAWRS